MLSNLDKLFREIEIITSASRDALESSLVSSSQGVDGDGVVVYLKKRARNSDGTISENANIIIDTIRLDSWAIITINKFFNEWKASGYDRTAFDKLLLKDNYYSSKVTYQGNEITTPATIALVKFSKALFGNVINLSEYDIETNINDRTVSDQDYSFSYENFEMINIGSSQLLDSKTFGEYSFRFENDDTRMAVAYWIFLIRNNKHPDRLCNSILVPYEVRNPSYDVNNSSDVFSSNLKYIMTSDWYNAYSMGIENDNIEHSLGGYSWKIISDSISTGIDSRAQGLNSTAFGYMANAPGDNSLAVQNNVANDINSSVLGWGNIAQYEFTFTANSSPIIFKKSCDSYAQATRKTIEIKIEGIVASQNFSSAAGQNGIYLYDLVTFDGNKIKKAIRGIVNSVETYTDGSGKAITVLDILPSSPSGLNVKSGTISRYTNSDSFVKSKFILGQYNKPNSGSIFQIGTGSSDAERDTFVEIGFNNDGYSNTYFKIGLDTYHDTIDYLRVEGNLLNFTIGDSILKLSEADNEIRYENDEAGSLVIDSSTGIVNIKNPANTGGYILSSDQAKVYHDSGSYVNIASNGNLIINSSNFITVENTTNININGGTRVTITWAENEVVEISPSVTEIVEKNIYVNIGKYNDDTSFSRLTTLASQNLSLAASDANYTLNSFQWNSSNDLTIKNVDGSSFDMNISGGILNINSELSMIFPFVNSSYAKIFGKNPSTSYNSKVTRSSYNRDQDLDLIKHSGFVWYADNLNDGYNIPGSSNSYIISNKHREDTAEAGTGEFNTKLNWMVGSDIYDIDDGIWSAIYNKGDTSVNWRRLAFSDEVYYMGLAHNYDASNAFAVFNSGDTDSIPDISGKISNFAIITENIEEGTIRFDQDSENVSSGIAKINIETTSIDFPPYISIAGTNAVSTNSTLNFKLGGVLKNSSVIGNKLSDGSIYFEWCMFSKVGNVVYFDISIRLDIIDKLYKSADKTKGILFVLGDNNPELCPSTEFSRRLIFQEQNQSRVNFRNNLRIIPFNDGKATAFIVTRVNGGRIYPPDQMTNADTNAAGPMGAFRAHFRGHYYSRNNDIIPYLTTANI